MREDAYGEVCASACTKAIFRHLVNLKSDTGREMTDSHYMTRALELAQLGGGWVNPNPQVGAVLVKESRVIGEGYHARFGGPHAERVTLEACAESPVGATLYVTLEPCCHTGKTPPCTEAITESGISKVVIGSDDPNPLVSGEGVKLLRDAGIEVVTGFLQNECDKINRIFFHYIKDKTPYVLAKYAMTVDGKIATYTGASQWITGEEARLDVQRLRDRYAAIMVGINTVLADDPLLTCRIEGGKDPLRVIVDSSLRIPLDSQIVQTARDVPTLLATAADDPVKRQQLEELGCGVLVLPTNENGLNLRSLFQILGQRGIDSVLIEGGPTVLGSAFDEGLVQAVSCYIAPKLFGGSSAPSPIGGKGVSTPDKAIKLHHITVKNFGDDLYIEGEVE